MARICPLFSGSSGNSYFVGSADAGILIDIGRKNINKSLGLRPSETVKHTRMRLIQV